MGTSTVTQAREPQKVGEPHNLNRSQEKPRNCVKTQMMQRDCAKSHYFSFFIIFWEFEIIFGLRQISVLWAGVPLKSEGKVRGSKGGREALGPSEIWASSRVLLGFLVVLVHDEDESSQLTGPLCCSLARRLITYQETWVGFSGRGGLMSLNG